MARKIVDKLLPTTMVGSYPRPSWFKHQLLGRDIRVAFKEVSHEEAYNDAVAAVIAEQETMGLDIVTDGNMWYDDYVGVIGSFCWYMYRAHRRLRTVARRAPVDGGRPARARARKSSTTGAASSTAAPRRTVRFAWPTCTRSPPSTPRRP